VSNRHAALGEALKASGFDARLVHDIGMHEVTLETGHFVRVLPPTEGDHRMLFGLAQQANYQGTTNDLGLVAPGSGLSNVRGYPAAPGEEHLVGEHLRSFMRDPAVVHSIRNDINDRRLNGPSAPPKRPTRRPLEDL
jgi:hypothetical protein